LTREERTAKARVAIRTRFGPKQQVFLDFVLSQCAIAGLQQEKVSPLLGVEVSRFDCGRSEIGRVFSRFQKYLHQQVA